MGHVTKETLVVIRMMANPLEGGALKETVKAVQHFLNSEKMERLGKTISDQQKHQILKAGWKGSL